MNYIIVNINLISESIMLGWFLAFKDFQNWQKGMKHKKNVMNNFFSTKSKLMEHNFHLLYMLNLAYFYFSHSAKTSIEQVKNIH